VCFHAISSAALKNWQPLTGKPGNDPDERSLVQFMYSTAPVLAAVLEAAGVPHVHAQHIGVQE